MFLTLLIFCVGSVCAAEPDNTTNDNINDYNTMRACIDRLEANDVNQTNMINELNTTVNNQAVKINELNNTINNLKDDNKALIDRVQALEYSKLTQSNRIKSLEIDIKNLDESNKQLIDSNNNTVKELESNKVLNNTVNNQTIIINELNNKLELQLIETNKLQSDKDKLNAEINKLKDEKCSIYEKLLSSPKKEDYEQLKNDIADKDNKIKGLNTKIETLNNILNINKKDVYNSLKALSSTNTQNIKCGKYTFKLEDYLKIPLIKDGKKNVLKFKNDNGRLPNYVIIAGIKVYQNVYKKLYNL